ncbi:MAG TPA: hypothetical protein VHT03_07655 [Rhizomicrobium sp.]|jgi:hypothetical protein|nr:hypothetical protein [Rhizomicrobium sp.]
MPTTLLRAGGIVSLAASITLLLAAPANAIPSFARQTGQPCATCHVGAFGPQLTQFGRDFKLNGYVWNDGKNHVPLAAMIQASLTHTAADQPGGAAPGFAANDNPAIDQVSLFYGGKVWDSLGAFVQVTYDGIAKQLTWDNLDVRYAETDRLFGKPLILGLTINNNPTLQDPWNSTPAWGFPFAGSGLAPTPAAATLADGGLAQTVMGAGGYALWDDTLYTEFDLYKGLGRDVRNALGAVPVAGSNSYGGVIPYLRVALQHDFGNHYLELGTFGLTSNVFVGGEDNFGRADRLTDLALDATWNYTGSEDHLLTGYLTYIHENQTLGESHFLFGANPKDTLDTFRANGSWSFQNTYTFSGQYFRTAGTSDAALYGGSPDSSGWNWEIAYVPSGKPGSWFPTYFNARLSLQYTMYNKFDGTSANASDNNTLFLLLWIAG